MRSNFNSRTSCEVRRFPGLIMPSWPKFQLTHLLRGATPFSRHCSSIRSISTHAPLARCDLGVTIPIENVRKDFNSRTSCEVRPEHQRMMAEREAISTHAPLARCDLAQIYADRGGQFQLTHLLRGATLPGGALDGCISFQLTHLLRGATQPDRMLGNPVYIFQLTHLLRGATGR